MDDDRVHVEMQRVFDALDAIKAPGDPEPSTVAEFARTPETRQALSDVLPPDELEELGRDLERQEATIDRPATPDVALLDLARRTRDDLKADATANGWQARARREIDQHRAGVGKDAYNEKRRADYADQKGSAVREYEKATPERRKEQYKASKKKARAVMTPDQKKAANTARTERRKAHRERQKAEGAAALKNGAIF
ncbi:hypothetical protein LB524_21405 [Mesorhizobium sp. ESP6-5]|uniref:hypothetical protein n=1 Tax=Mesorhizobium sp. ESP6-5 TaxID=2876623 RepID=UPI001CCA5B30|nr:hypothetical protein [Mesorhizobium sp. ESP6-5]MBZ9757847.1 hypothetical protein [Mesorhizobium sp. ESP6-5]